MPWLYSIAMKFFAVFTFIMVCSTSLAVLPSYSPAIRNNTVMRDEIIENYFSLGLTAPEIALFLISVHGIGISLRQLKRTLRRLGCTRRRRRSNLNEVVEAVEEELRGSGSLLGYRGCIKDSSISTVLLLRGKPFDMFRGFLILKGWSIGHSIDYVDEFTGVKGQITSGSLTATTN